MLLLLLFFLYACHGSSTAPSYFRVNMTFSLPPPQNSLLLEVNRSWAPLGVDRFYQLIQQQRYYNQNAMFRVLQNFVAQFGINGSPAVSSRWVNATIADDPVVLSNVRGTLCYATAGPNTRTTQLFFNYANNSFLDGQGFAPFARVMGNGMSVVDRLYSQYGESSDQQDEIYAVGNSYLKQNFPLLTYLTTAVVVSH